MKRNGMKGMGRRAFLGSTAALGAGFLAEADVQAAMQRVQTNSKPSELKITDMRIADLPSRPIIRLDTNQGIQGYGEVRDGASKLYALELKRLVVGQNPATPDAIFRRIKQFGHHARQAGGVCGVEMALWDLAGKAYGVPVYQLLGGKFRDRIRIYADTPSSPDPKVFGERLKRRVEQGFTFLKMDVGIGLVQNTEGTLTYPTGQSLSQGDNKIHMFTGIEVTDKGIAMMADYLYKVREVVGWQVPIATDHYGHIGVNSCIRMGKAFEKMNLAWLEDCIPWQYTELWKKITDAVDIPTLTGEDIFLKEPFEELCREHAVDIIQPDLASSGGILETHKIGDMAEEYGVPMAMHMAGSPVSNFASIHCAAATNNFLVLENHSVDSATWADIVDGVEKPIINKGYTRVPDSPGLGFTINEEALKKQVGNGGYFLPTTEWDGGRGINDRLWS
jgi:L-alanine-DL-glutamate epimerase-like enolase superfamily enzyme